MLRSEVDIRLKHHILGVYVRDISELRKMMTAEQIAESERNFRKFYPEGTPVVNCTSDEDCEKYLVKVGLKDFT
jgi:hypothetical protein